MIGWDVIQPAAVEDNVAPCWALKASNEAERCGLAAARWPQERHELPLGDGERHPTRFLRMGM